MNIAIDFTSVIYRRGVSRYTQNLALAVSTQKNVSLTLFGYSLRQKDKLLAAAKTIPNAKTKFLPIPTKIMEKIWDFKLQSVQSQLPDIDIFHSWDWIQPPDKNIPIVSTIHDLSMLKFPETAHPKILSAHKKSWEILKEKKAHLIAVSRTTKNDIVTLLGYPAYMVHVVSEALPIEFVTVANAITQDQENYIKQQLDLSKPYILFVGTREPRKNLNRLIEAWQPLAKSYELIIAGETGWDTSSETANNAKYKPRFLGRVTDAQLSVLYANAEVFAYPSLYEGFGLPILESFHHGTPVLTSNNSGMAEVAGNAAQLIDPESVASITQGLTTLLNETSQEQGKRLQRMIIRLQMYNWEQTARETIEVYSQAIQDFKNK